MGCANCRLAIRDNENDAETEETTPHANATAAEIGNGAKAVSVDEDGSLANPSPLLQVLAERSTHDDDVHDHPPNKNNGNSNDAGTEETPPNATPTPAVGLVELKKEDENGNAVQKTDSGVGAKAVLDQSPSSLSNAHAVAVVEVEAVKEARAVAVDTIATSTEDSDNGNTVNSVTGVKADDGDRDVPVVNPASNVPIEQADQDDDDEDDDEVPNNNSNENGTTGTEQVAEDDNNNEEVDEDDDELINSDSDDEPTDSGLEDTLDDTPPPTLTIKELIKAREETYRMRAKETITSASDAIKDKAKENDPLYPLRPYGLDEEMEGIRSHVWDIIFVHVNDLDAVKSLRDVCTMFRDLLDGKFAAAMLPEAINYCLDRKFIPWNSTWGSTRFQKSNWLKTLQKLRTVSKAAKHSVDLQFNRDMLRDWSGGQEHDWFRVHMNPHYRNYTTEEWKIPTLMLGALDVERARLQSTLDSLANHEIFPMRAVVFNEFRIGGGHVDLQELRNAFQRCLEKMGGKITSFRYKTFENYLNVYNNLKQWLARMPNLEELMVEFAGWRNTRRYEIVGAFVTCPKLKRFAEGRHGFGYPFINEILRANPTLEEVLLGHMSSLEVEANRLNDVLDTLQVTKFHSTWMPTISFFDHRFQWAEQLTRFNLLDKRTVVPARDMIPSDTVFGFISQFKNLTDLGIFSLCIRDTGGFLELPKLEKLMWKVHSEFKSLEFLKPAEELKWLWLDLRSCPELQDDDEEEEKEEVMQYLGEHNIPRLFPALKWIQVKTENNGKYKIWGP